MKYYDIPKEQYKERYDGLYSEEPNLHWNKPDHWKHADTLISQLDDNVSTVLDVGCGDGVVLCRLIESGYSAVGCDVSSVALKDADINIFGKLGVHPNVCISDVRSLQFSDFTFDAIIFSEVIEHLSDIDVPTAIAELIRVSKQNSQIIVSSCDKKEVTVISEDTMQKIHLLYSPNHIHERTCSELTDELSRYFSIEQSKVGGSPLTFKTKINTTFKRPKIYISGRVRK